MSAEIPYGLTLETNNILSVILWWMQQHRNDQVAFQNTKEGELWHSVRMEYIFSQTRPNNDKLFHSG